MRGLHYTTANSGQSKKLFEMIQEFYRMGRRVRMGIIVEYDHEGIESCPIALLFPHEENEP